MSMAKNDTPDWWYDERVAVPAGARALTPVYAGVTALRRWMYRHRLLRARAAGVPVVVVGNLSAGGSGKTPMTIALVQRLVRAGWKPGVASRGYGRKDPAARWIDASTTPDQGGDEPLLIAARTQVPVRVDRDRVAAARALAQAGCDIVVCDDGLQHYRLARDLEIEVIDGRRRYGNRRLMPAGPLREPEARGKLCDFRVLNIGDGRQPGIEAGFGEWTMRLAADAAVPVAGGRSLPLDAFRDRRVHAVAGIGHPERFFGMLRGRGIPVVPHAFGDHHAYRAADFDFGSDLPVLMTEKDAVKCRGFADARCYCVPIDAELPEAFWVALLERLAGNAGGHGDAGADVAAEA